jgi:arylsulfatase A-like enzyme
MNRMNKRKILALFFFAFGLIILFFAVIKFGKSENFNGCDLINSFDDAKKKNFDPAFDIDSCFPDKAYTYDIKIIREKLANLFSGNITILSKDGKNLTFLEKEFDSAALRLIFPPDAGKRSFVFKYKIKDENNFFKVEVISDGSINKIIICRFRDGKEESIDDFTFQGQTSENNILVIAFYRDYLVLINDDYVLYQQKDRALAGSGRISFDYYSDKTRLSRYVAKFVEITNAAEQELVNIINWSHPNLRDHKFNLNNTKWNPPSFRQFITESDKKRNFVRRLKLGAEVRPVIYFPINSSLEYEVSMPEKAHLELFLALLPDNVFGMDRIRFKVQLISTDGKNEQESIVKFPIGKADKLRFTRFSVDLSRFSGKRRFLKLSFFTVDGGLKPSESKILLACGSPVVYGRSTSSKSKNIVLISLDTLRADHLGCYSYFRNSSPNIDKIAKEGIVFANAASCSNWTLPSHLSMLTGLYPSETGFIEGNAVSNTFVAEDVDTIASYLRSQNYKTAGFHGGGYLSEYFGFDKGFDFYLNTRPDITSAMGQVLKWLNNNKDDKFFLFFHTYETHAPYTNKYFLSQLPTVSVSPFDKSVAAYDSDIYNADKELGILFEWLKKNGLYEQTIIIITSDHGENFDYVKKEGDPGSHGKTLYDSEMRIPLIIRGGEFINGKIIKSQVSSVDILPTIAKILDIDIDDKIRGIDLGRLLEKDNLTNRLVYMESTPPGQILRGVRSSNFKLIARNLPKLKTVEKKTVLEYEFFDLTADNKEKRNLWNAEKSLSKKYLDQLKIISSSVSSRGYSNAAKRIGAKVMDNELQEQLKALGYLGN